MADSTEEITTETTTETTSDELGDGGKKALDAERAARRSAEKTAKAHETELAKARAELDEVRSGQLSEHEKALETARKEAHDAATASSDEKYRKRLDAADVKAAAAKFADPADALRYLDLETLKRDADGVLEESALAAALAEVLTEKPYLAGVGTGNGSADGGTRGGGERRPPQLSRSDLKSMTPRQIHDAREAGKLEDLLTAK